MQLLQNSSFSKLHPVETFPYCKDTLTKAAFSVRHQLVNSMLSLSIPQDLIGPCKSLLWVGFPSDSSKMILRYYLLVSSSSNIYSAHLPAVAKSGHVTCTGTREPVSARGEDAQEILVYNSSCCEKVPN